mgnify:CR=1 FL=1
MTDPEKLLRDERWIPLDSIGFANGDLILLEPRDTEEGTSLEPLLRSTISSYLEYNDNGLSSLTQMWTFEFGHSTFSGGGGGLGCGKANCDRRGSQRVAQAFIGNGRGVA